MAARNNEKRRNRLHTAPPGHKGDDLMSKHDPDTRRPGLRQYKSPLSRDLESCAANLAALAGRVGEAEWIEISLIRMQLRALADQAEDLVIPSNEEVA